MVHFLRVCAGLRLGKSTHTDNSTANATRRKAVFTVTTSSTIVLDNEAASLLIYEAAFEAHQTFDLLAEAVGDHDIPFAWTRQWKNSASF